MLLGTFGVLAAFHMTINTLTMLAMVLAIGLLVDDAIVVVENVERVMEEEALSPKEATRKSMDQITGALVGIATGAVRGVFADGVLRRFGRRRVPAVLRHHHFGDGAVGAGGDRRDAGAVRHHVEAGRTTAIIRRRAASSVCSIADLTGPATFTAAASAS